MFVEVFYDKNKRDFRVVDKYGRNQSTTRQTVKMEESTYSGVGRSQWVTFKQLKAPLTFIFMNTVLPVEKEEHCISEEETSLICEAI